MKRIVGKLFMALLVLYLTACGGEKEGEGVSGSAKLPAYPESAKENVAKKSEDKNISIIEETCQKSSEKMVKLCNDDFLQVMMANDYLSEWIEEEGDIGKSVKLCEASWQTLELTKEFQKKYPKLDEKLKAMNKEANQYNREFIDAIVALATEHYEDSRESFGTYYNNSSYSLVRGDKYILSIQENAGEYTGGAHGMYGTWGINFDPVTGEELQLTDVLTTTDDLPAMIADKIMEEYADEYETFETLEEYLEENYKPEDYQWVMGYGGITIFFNPYEIASYSMGILKVDIGFLEMPELFVEKYMQSPESGYLMEIPLDKEIVLDINPVDNEKDKLFISTYYAMAEDAEYGIHRMSIVLNDSIYEEEEYYGYEFKAYLACVKAEETFKYYLYVESVSENDFRTFHIYDLNHGMVQVKEQIGGLGFSGYLDDSVGEYGVYYYFVPNNAQSFELVSRMEILGTWSGRRMYSVHPEDGMPKPSEDYYYLSHTSYPIVSLIPLEVMMLPRETKVELPAGTKFYFLRTDGKSYVDARLEDGRECRIYVEFNGWEQSINGIDQWECFENLPYAG